MNGQIRIDIERSINARPIAHKLDWNGVWAESENVPLANLGMVAYQFTSPYYQNPNSPDIQIADHMLYMKFDPRSEHLDSVYFSARARPAPIKFSLPAQQRTGHLCIDFVHISGFKKHSDLEIHSCTQDMRVFDWKDCRVIDLGEATNADLLLQCGDVSWALRNDLLVGVIARRDVKMTT